MAPVDHLQLATDEVKVTVPPAQIVVDLLVVIVGLAGGVATVTVIPGALSSELIEVQPRLVAVTL